MALNAMSLLGVVMGIAYMILFWLAEATGLLLLPTFAGVCSALVLVLSHRGYHRLNRIVYFSWVAPLVTVFSLAAGNSSEVQDSVYLLVCLPFLVCHPAERAIRGYGVALPIAGRVLIEAARYELIDASSLHRPVSFPLHLVMVPTILVFIIVLVSAFTSSSFRDERELEARHRTIVDRERRLRQAKSFQERVMSSMHDCLFVVSTEGIIEHCNRAAEMLLGYSKDELVGRPMGILLPPLEEVPPGLIGSWETTLEPKEGERIPIHFSGSAILTAEGDSEGIVCVVRDIRERMRNEAALKTLLELSPIGLIVVGRDGRVERCNETLSRLFGYTPREIIGSSASQLFSRPGDSKEVELGTIFASEEQDTGPSVHHGVVGRRHDGSTFPIHLSSALATIGEQAVAILAVADRTEQERVDEEQRAMERKVAHASGMAEVATGVLHNVGNVVNSINISAAAAQGRLSKSSLSLLSQLVELLKSQGSTPEALQAFLRDDPRGQKFSVFLAAVADQLKGEHGKIDGELGELREHVRHIMAIVSSQQEFARPLGSIEDIDLTSFVEKAIVLSGIATSQKGIRVERDCEADLGIRVDPHKLMQILVNLLSNARDAVGDNASEDRVIGVQTYRLNDEAIVIAVIDNGVGIPKENLNRIFAHGFTTKADGHGFGLHISATSAMELGGKLKVESDGAGKGARFRLQIPTAARRAA